MRTFLLAVPILLGSALSSAQTTVPVEVETGHGEATPREQPGLAALNSYGSRRVSSADRRGNRDAVRIGAGETTEIARLDGPGEITHLWTTIATGDMYHLRNTVIRIYWDGSEFPSVEAPIGDFYGLGHSRYYYFSNPVQAIGTSKGMNCFWPMPFAKGARITITNEGDKPLRAFYYYVDWRQFDSWPEGTGYFHAQYRQARPNENGKPYLFVDTAGAPGHFVGANLSVHTQSPGWWGEGDDIFTIDGETTPSLWGTGSEDYFSGAWGFGKEFFNDYFGMPLRTRMDHGGNNYWNVYRLHLESPIPFEKSLRFEMEHGWEGTSNVRPRINNNYSSVAYWYMAKPVALKGGLPPAGARIPGLIPRPGVTDHYFDPQYMDWLAFEDTTVYHDHIPAPGEGARWLDDDQLAFVPEHPGARATLAFETTAPQTGPLVLRMTAAPDYGIVQVRLNGITVLPSLNLYSPKRVIRSVELAGVDLEAGKQKLQVTSMGKDRRSKGLKWGMDYLRIGGEPLDVEKEEARRAERPDEVTTPSSPSPAGLEEWLIFNGQWSREARVIHGGGNLDNRLLLARPAPPSFVWPVTVELKEGWSAGALVWTDSAGKNGYAVRLDNRRGALLLERVGAWPEVKELASFPWQPTDGPKLALRVHAGANNIRVFWPEKSEYPVLEALNVEPAGDRIGFQVLDGRASFGADLFWPTEAQPVTGHKPTAGESRHVYNPSVGESEPWYINDHCFIQGPDGWHLYGITHAKPADAWDELTFAHALSSDLPGTTGTWQKRPYALRADPAAGERQLWAPHVVKRGDTWYMFYCAGSLESDSHFRIHLATSKDLHTWTRHPDNPLFKDTFHARDPMVFEDNGVYYLYYTANMDRGRSHHTVNVRTSRDLLHWSPATVAFVHPAEGTGAGPTESPFVVKYEGHFYLFIGPDGEYHRTAVFRSSNPLHWENSARVSTIPSHAAEVVRNPAGEWFVSDSGWDLEGVYLAPLRWEEEGDDTERTGKSR